MTVSNAKRLKALEQENVRLKKLRAETMRAGAGGDPRGASQKVVGAPARREVGHWMCWRGLAEHRALKVVGMSANSLRYQPAPDRNAELRQVILTLPIAINARELA